MSDHTPEIDLTNESLNADFGHGSIDLCNSSKESLAKFNREKDGWEYPTKAIAMAWARRIVACVNACRWMSTEALETHGEHAFNAVIQDAVDARNTAIRERDEARAMAQRYLDAVEHVTKERDEARAMVKRLADALRDAANENYRDEWDEMADEADPPNMPQTTTCPHCYHVWPGKPTKCKACDATLDHA